MPSKWDHVFTESIWMTQAKRVDDPLCRKGSTRLALLRSVWQSYSIIPYLKFQAFSQNITLSFGMPQRERRLTSFLFEYPSSILH